MHIPQLSEQGKYIDDLVQCLKSQILICNPLSLLAYCHNVAVRRFTCPNIGPETPQVIADTRAAEYVQSVFISCSKCDLINRGVEDERTFKNILARLAELYQASMPLLLAIDTLRNDKTIGNAHANSMFSALCSFTIRGRRHVAYQHAYHAMLLQGHEDVIQKLYGISIDNLVDGLDKLIGILFFGDNGLPDAKSYEVEAITNWPRKLVEDLSFKIGNGSDFLKDDFAGWVFKDSPVKERPFIEVNGRIYAFSYYTVSDYFYRAIQFAVTRRSREEKIPYIWHKNQCAVSEAMAREAFIQLLPKSTVYCGNYYQDNEGKWTENDLLIQFSDVLIIIEVKGGAFSHESPLTNYDMIHDSYDNIAKAIFQCRRMETYCLSGSNSVVLFDAQHSVKNSIDISCCKFLFKIVMTVDNVGEIACCADTLSAFAGESKGVICLSLDDLMVYVDNFSGNPILFLCYLQTRHKMTEVSNSLNVDELDYLDMFSCNPNYWRIAEAETSKPHTFINMGSGIDLDTTHVNLPDIPSKIMDIFQFTGLRKVPRALEISLFLIGQSHEFLIELDKNIGIGLSKSQAIGHAVSFMTSLPNDFVLSVVISEGDNMFDEFIRSSCEYVSGKYQKNYKQYVVLGLCYRGSLDFLVYKKGELQ